jgi:hypothetical protein
MPGEEVDEMTGSARAGVTAHRINLRDASVAGKGADGSRGAGRQSSIAQPRARAMRLGNTSAESVRRVGRRSGGTGKDFALPIPRPCAYWRSAHS